ncbi:uncharacterized protein [Lolium perenne]|uniref:uncharacterized protein n=1 Tax=Lolium perenne TaxID=4522 RepID=UPI003A9944CF
MIGPDLFIADWNTRGLNDQARKDTVHAFLADTRCHIACIQETKLDHIDQQTAYYIGGFKLRSFAHRPATGTRGGILLLWNDEHVEISNVHLGTHLISANVSVRSCGTSFKLTTVYGPTDHAEKEAFLTEAIAAKPPDDSNWLIIGDFNLIYQKSPYLKELKLQNRKFTWSNERQTPTLVRLDRAFCNTAWDLAFENHALFALSSSLSDHCLILLSNQSGPRKPPIFRFESFWTKMPGFREVVQQAWSAPSSHSQPVHVINHNLKATAMGLKSWSRSLFSDSKLQLLMALDVILQLDVAQESRALSEDEIWLRASLKRRVKGLAAMDRSRKRQASKILYLREGDANTKFFHLRVNARRRKNLIVRLMHNNGWAVTHEDKAGLIFDHFSRTLGRPPPRSLDFN